MTKSDSRTVYSVRSDEFDASVHISDLSKYPLSTAGKENHQVG